MAQIADTPKALSLSHNLLQIAADTQRRVLGTTIPDWLADTLKAAPATHATLVQRVAEGLDYEPEEAAPVSHAFHVYVQHSRTGRKRMAVRAVLHLLGREVGAVIDARHVRNVQEVLGAENYAATLLMADAEESPWRLPTTAAGFDQMVQDCLGRWLRLELGQGGFLAAFLSDVELALARAADDRLDPPRLRMAFSYAAQGIGSDG